MRPCSASPATSPAGRCPPARWAPPASSPSSSRPITTPALPLSPPHPSVREGGLAVPWRAHPHPPPSYTPTLRRSSADGSCVGMPCSTLPSHVEADSAYAQAHYLLSTLLCLCTVQRNLQHRQGKTVLLTPTPTQKRLFRGKHLLKSE
ncbi:hypothetical protein AGOR_G00091980 [Albula goreensis]|uniref:Uncharacterized protein n=1 Tax=Albula goreensis TaxID=1534307 RepID=A0A8T3DFW2_9TELE|nr:hypothetical protein AGOR_G00091980 [Albula goreensis]